MWMKLSVALPRLETHFFKSYERFLPKHVAVHRFGRKECFLSVWWEQGSLWLSRELLTGVGCFKHG